MCTLRRLCLFAFLLVLSLSFAPLTFAQEVEIVTEKINDNFYMITTNNPEDSTVLLHLGDDGAVLVDSHWSFNNAPIRTAIAEITDLPISYVINTHWHPDHTDGNASFNETGAHLLAHENVRTRMAEG